MKTQVLKLNKKSLELAVNLIKNDEIVAFPTDTVYGVGASAFSDVAVKKIYEAKGRPETKPLLLLVGRNYNLENLVVEINETAKKLMTAFWPGALTLIFKSKQNISSVASAGSATVGIRIPNDKTALSFLEACNLPLATPSANISGMKSPICASDVLCKMNERIPLILDGGECAVKTESTIVDVTGSEIKILRQGAITEKQILDAITNI